MSVIANNITSKIKYMSHYERGSFLKVLAMAYGAQCSCTNNVNNIITKFKQNFETVTDLKDLQPIIDAMGSDQGVSLKFLVDTMKVVESTKLIESLSLTIETCMIKDVIIDTNKRTKGSKTSPEATEDGKRPISRT